MEQKGKVRSEGHQLNLMLPINGTIARRSAHTGKMEESRGRLMKDLQAAGLRKPG